MSIQVTDSKFFKTKSNSGIIGNGSVTLDNMPFSIKVAIWSGDKGLSVMWPSKKLKDKEGNDKYYDDLFWSDFEVKKEANSAIIEAWEVFAGSAKKASSAKTTSSPSVSKNTKIPARTNSELEDDMPF